MVADERKEIEFSAQSAKSVVGELVRGSAKSNMHFSSFQRQRTSEFAENKSEVKCIIDWNSF